MAKNILFAITKGNWGGAQRYVFDLASNLPRDRFNVSVLCGAGEGLAAKLKEKNIRVISMGSLNRDVRIVKDAETFVAFYKLLLAERPDILHLNSSKIGLIGAITGRLAGVPKIIFTGHGWAWNEDRNFFSKILFTFGHWLTIKLSHTTIAVCEKVRNEIIRLPLVAETGVTVIHNGVADIEYLERFSARGLIGGEISEKFWVGAIAELHRNKGLDVLIAAFARVSETHPDTALIIIGEGEERKRLETLIQKLHLSKKIHLLGFQENAGKFLKSFDVFVLASRTEAFPYVLLEAGLAQLPVVATQVGGIPESVSNGKSGLLVEADNAPALSDALNELLGDTAKAAILGHNLRKTVEEKFSVGTMVQKTMNVYN